MTMSRLGLNLPNLISLGRLLLVPLAISLILEGSYWAAFWTFVIAAAPRPLRPLFISKVNTGVQVALVGYILARRGLGFDPGLFDAALSMAVAATTLVSG